MGAMTRVNMCGIRSWSSSPAATLLDDGSCARTRSSLRNSISGRSDIRTCPSNRTCGKQKFSKLKHIFKLDEKATVEKRGTRIGFFSRSGFCGCALDSLNAINEILTQTSLATVLLFWGFFFFIFRLKTLKKKLQTLEIERRACAFSYD